MPAHRYVEVYLFQAQIKLSTLALKTRGEISQKQLMYCKKILKKFQIQKMSSLLKILFMTHGSQNEILLWCLYLPPSRLRLRESNVNSYVCLSTREGVHVQDPAPPLPLFWPLALPPVTFSNMINLNLTVLGPVP